jgi:CheY-like chemotaxis protein
VLGERSGFRFYLQPDLLEQLERALLLRELGVVRISRLAHRARTASSDAAQMPYERQHCLDAGMDDVLVKPYAVTDLPRAVARWAA